MKLRNTAVLLSMLALLLTGCGKEEPAVSQTEGTEKAQAAGETEAATQAADKGKVHINVETVEISLSDLKAQDYTVPVIITLEENAGVTYTEWGLSVDERCTFAVDEEAEDLAMTVYHAINEEQHFLWTAWASAGEPNTRTGKLMVLDVTIPENAKAGDFYTVDYADWSLADKPHVWSSNDNSWGESEDVTWVDGGIQIIE